MIYFVALSLATNLLVMGLGVQKAIAASPVSINFSATENKAGLVANEANILTSNVDAGTFTMPTADDTAGIVLTTLADLSGIPAGASINGLELDVTASANNASTMGGLIYINDDANHGVYEEKAIGALATVTFGGSTHLGDLPSVSVDDLDTLKVAIATSTAAVADTVVSVRYAFLKIYYTEPTGNYSYNPTFGNLPGTTSPVNVEENQTITTANFTLEAMPASRIGIDKVEFYVDDNLICTDRTPDANGVYTCDWDTTLYHSIVKIIAYDRAGGTTTILRTLVVAGAATTPTTTKLPETGADL